MAALLLLGGLAWRQAGFWENDGTLFRRTLQVDGGRNTAALKNLTWYYFEVDHDLGKVIDEYERLLQVDEDIATWNAGHLYIIALYESGQWGRADRELPRYQRRCFELMERDRVRKQKRKQSFFGPFLMASAAQAIVRGEYDVAEGHFENMRELFSVDPVCDYLEGVMRLGRGEPERALAIWRGIRPNERNYYFQFRWLKDRLPADDAEALKILPSFAWKTPDDAEGPAK